MQNKERTGSWSEGNTNLNSQKRENNTPNKITTDVSTGMTSIMRIKKIQL